MESPSLEQMFGNFDLYGDADRSKALDVIDKIREAQIGETSLPQLVALGDQSCGKSSVMENITGIPFPIESSLCTRFATQIVLRRTDTPANQAVVQASILPGPTVAVDANSDARAKLEEFKFSCKESEFGPAEFLSLIKNAGRVMGIEHNARGHTSRKRFSDDILRIELAGIHHSHLTIVDVPGLFHNPTLYQTEEDVHLVRELVQHYVNDPRTIIIAVMNGSNELAAQEVFKIAKKADPNGKRTVGVMTKCDRVQEGSEEEPLQIALNKTHYLHHGWFVVRNRSPTERSDGIIPEQLRAIERDFFKNKPWNRLDPNQIGVDKLKVFLGRLLYQHIQNELPRLAQEINQIIRNCKERLGELGDGRIDSSRQRQYLTMIAKNYENHVTRYLNSDFGEMIASDSPLKIRTHIQKLHEDFAADMEVRGHTRAFKTIDGLEDNRHYNSDNDDNMLGPRDIIDWIREEHRNSRGPELRGLINPHLIVALFREQAKNWRWMAKDHVHAIVDIVESFNTALFAKVISDEVVHRRIKMRVSSEISDSISRAYEVLDKIIQDEFDGILQTVDEDYLTAYEEAKVERIRACLIGKEEFREALPVMEAIAVFMREDCDIENIHDILKAFYPIVLKRFIATINLQVVERKLLGDGGPIRLLKTEYISQLSDEELNNITREDLEILKTREELQSRLDRATKALQAANSI